MSLLSRDELQALARQSGGPCVSIYLPTYRAGAEVQQNAIRFKNLLRETEEKLAQQGAIDGSAGELLAGPRSLLDDYDFWQHQSDGLAVFVAPGILRRFRVPVAFEELVVVGERFHLTPLLPFLTGDGRFYVLALSQKQVRLLEGSRASVREIDLRDIPESLADALGYDWEERSLQFHTGAISAGRGGRAVFHGQGAGEDDKKEEITRFLKIVDSGLNRLLRDRQAPLVVAAVDYLIAIYREVTQYPNLVDKGIEGSPDGLSADELRDRAWPLVEPRFHQGEKEAAARFRQLVGTGRASDDLDLVVPAAIDGRVDTLFVAVGAHQWGRFDTDARQVVEVGEGPNGDNEDLLDRAALESFLHGATVYAVEQGKVPAEGPVAAVFRY